MRSRTRSLCSGVRVTWSLKNKYDTNLMLTVRWQSWDRETRGEEGCGAHQKGPRPEWNSGRCSYAACALGIRLQTLNIYMQKRFRANAGAGLKRTGKQEKPWEWIWKKLHWPKTYLKEAGAFFENVSVCNLFIFFPPFFFCFSSIYLFYNPPVENMS